MDWSAANLAGIEFPCECGRTHKVPIKKLRMGRSVLSFLGADAAELGLPGRAVIIADDTTFQLAGETVKQELVSAGISVDVVILRPHRTFGDRNWVLPDEQALGTVLMSIPSEPCFLVAVGSGTIGDVTRFVAAKTGKPFLSVGTAPSMDGYASTVAALLTGTFKKTLPAAFPLGIYVDADVVATAPLEMVAAGFGDLVGKSVSLADWMLSHILNGEYYCPQIAALVNKVLDLAISDVGALRRREPDALVQLTEGLVLSGVAILMFNDSRPVSGAEHELAHFWEIRGIPEGKLFYHGAKVAVATPLVTRFYHELLSYDPTAIDWEKVRSNRRSLDAYSRQLKADFGSAWETIATPAWKKSKGTEFERDSAELLSRTWAAIRAKVPESLLAEERILADLETLGAPRTPKELGLKREWLEASLRSGREMKPHRYTVMDLAAEMGVLEEVSEKVLDHAWK